MISRIKSGSGKCLVRLILSILMTATTVTLVDAAEDNLLFSRAVESLGAVREGPFVRATAPETIVSSPRELAEIQFDLHTIARGDGTGQIRSQSPDAGIDCPDDCRESYPIGSVVILTAAAQTGSMFTGWSGTGCRGTGSCKLTMDGFKFVFAQFDKLSDADGDGVADGIDICPMTPHRQIANASGCSVYQLDDDHDGVSNAEDKCPHTKSGTDVDDFGCPIEFNLDIRISGDGYGRVSNRAISGLIDCPDLCRASFEKGSVVTLLAAANTDSSFKSWSWPGCDDSRSCTVTMDENILLVATFVDLDTDDDGVTDEFDKCPNTAAGALVDITGCSEEQRDDDKDRVNNALDNCPHTPPGTEVDAHGCRIEPPDTDNDGIPDVYDKCPNTSPDLSVDEHGCPPEEPTFTPSSFALNVSVSGDGSGMVAMSTENNDTNCSRDCYEFYAIGSVVTLTATANLGSLFQGWSGTGCSGTGNCVLTIDDNKFPTATFITTADGAGDGDGDGVEDSDDRCPDTGPGVEVNATGCPLLSEPTGDADGDGVPDDIDQCPGTGPEIEVNDLGCPLIPTVTDTDSDGVIDDIDQCPNTQIGVEVNNLGCPILPGDDDGDNVPNDIDQCSDTPPGTEVDAVGCPVPPADADADHVPDDIDQCPETPAGVDVDGNGCRIPIPDGDGDGVADDIDECPNTPSGEAVDARGCSEPERDDDKDLVRNASDQCPDTPPTEDIDEVGCSASQQIDTLTRFSNLSPTEKVIATRIDEVCPALSNLSAAIRLEAGQKQLLDACSALKNRNNTAEQTANALSQISLKELGAQQDYAIEVSTAQYRQVASRLEQLRSGAAGGGLSVTGLNLKAGDKVIAADVLKSALTDILGLGASADDQFADFGRFGIFLQGDVRFGDRDDSDLESGYGFDSWNFALGADYRFTNALYAGLSYTSGAVAMDFTSDGGSSDISSWALSAYGGYQLSEEWFVDGLISFGVSEFDTLRHIEYSLASGNFRSGQDGNTKGHQLFAGLNTGYLFTSQGFRYGPTLSVSYLDGDIDGFTERPNSINDSSAWNFIVDDQSYESVRVSVGFQADYAISTSFGVLLPGLRASYVKEINGSNDAVMMRLAHNPINDTDLNSAQIAANFDKMDTGFFDLSFNISGQFAFGISSFVSYQLYSAYDGYSQEGFTYGLRWDKSF